MFFILSYKHYMKNTFKRTIVLLTIGTVLSYSATSLSKTNRQTSDFKAVKYEQSFERGKNLVLNICADCHYNKKTGKLTGMQMKDFPSIGGKLYSANLTDSKEYGVMNFYSDGDLYYLLRTGYKKDGGFAPYMLRPNMADRDINDIIVYLRSGDDLVSDGEEIAGTTHVNFIGRTGVRFYIKPVPYKTGVPSPRENHAIEYGSYLIDNLGCYHCHSQNALHLNYEHPNETKGYLAGGAKFKTANGKVYGANLTPDRETGIGSFSKEDFRTAVREGKTPNGDKLIAPMPKFRHLTDRQCDAIYAYLMQMPAKHHAIKH
jgi:mono/diheme cytochrome c family protein